MVGSKLVNKALETLSSAEIMSIMGCDKFQLSKYKNGSINMTADKYSRLYSHLERQNVMEASYIRQTGAVKSRWQHDQERISELISEITTRVFSNNRLVSKFTLETHRGAQKDTVSVLLNEINDIVSCGEKNGCDIISGYRLVLNNLRLWVQTYLYCDKTDEIESFDSSNSQITLAKEIQALISTCWKCGIDSPVVQKKNKDCFRINCSGCSFNMLIHYPHHEL